MEGMDPSTVELTNNFDDSKQVDLQQNHLLVEYPT